MADPYGRSDATGWFVGIIISLALLAIGYLMFSANSESVKKLDSDQVRCMIANPGYECEPGWVKVERRDGGF